MCWRAVRCSAPLEAFQPSSHQRSALIGLPRASSASPRSVSTCAHWRSGQPALHAVQYSEAFVVPAAPVLAHRHAVVRARNQLLVVVARCAVEEHLIAAHGLFVVAEPEVVLRLAERQRRILEPHPALAAARRDERQEADRNNPTILSEWHSAGSASGASRTSPSPCRRSPSRSGCTSSPLMRRELLEQLALPRASACAASRPRREPADRRGRSRAGRARPCPCRRKTLPDCVPAGIFIFTLPSSVGTSISVPSAACGKLIGTSQMTSLPSRVKSGCSRTWMTT